MFLDWPLLGPVSTARVQKRLLQVLVAGVAKSKAISAMVMTSKNDLNDGAWEDNLRKLSERVWNQVLRNLKNEECDHNQQSYGLAYVRF